MQRGSADKELRAVKSESEDEGPRPTSLIPSTSRARLKPAKTKSGEKSLQSSKSGPHSWAHKLPHVPETYTEYVVEEDIDYSPESAVDEGIRMAKLVEAQLMEIELSTELNNRSWLKQLEGFTKHRLPCTKIAVYGMTGAGKSSLLNAILGDNIVPTSGISACTSAAIEIGYHENTVITAEIDFLERSEWSEELGNLLVQLAQLSEKSDNPVEPSSLSDEALASWERLHAVYPKLELKQVINMTPESIIDSESESNFDDRKAAEWLGQTKIISHPDSDGFTAGFAKYVKSKDCKKEANPRFWPLVRGVRVWVKSEALSTGALLVDLPGVGDTNLARRKITEGYIGDCDCIWIVTPIARATDDKLAQDLLGEAMNTELIMDGKYNAAITLIATQTDSILCQEIITDLDLEAHPELIELESDLEKVGFEAKKSKTDVTTLSEEIEDTKCRIQELKDTIELYETYRKSLDLNNLVLADNVACGSKKRKRGVENQQAKRVCMGANDGPVPMDTDQDGGSIGIDWAVNAVTDGWMGLVKEKKGELDSSNASLGKLELDHSAAEKAEIQATASRARILKAKKTFCALQRNKATKEELEMGFKRYLKPLGSHNLPSPPVFTCSAHDYMIIMGQIRGDEPSCFTNPRDTEIPTLREWCQKLAAPARQQSALSLLKKLKALLDSIRPFIDRVVHGNPSDCATLAKQWRSHIPAGDWSNQGSGSHGTRPQQKSQGVAAQLRQRLNIIVEDTVQQLKYAFREGIEPSCHTGVERAALAAVQTSDDFALSVQRCQTYRAILRRDGEWLRRPSHRHGEWRHFNLNSEIVQPLINNIAVPWALQFDSSPHMLAQAMQAVETQINNLLGDLKDMVPPSLASQYAARHQIASSDARLAINRILGDIITKLQRERCNISKHLASKVKDELHAGYQLALEQHGPGSFSRQKSIIHNYIENRREIIFMNCQEALLRRLDHAAEAIRRPLTLALAELSDTTEIIVSVVWDIVPDDKDLIPKRFALTQHVHGILHQLKFWLGASRKWGDTYGLDAEGHVNRPPGVSV